MLAYSASMKKFFENLEKIFWVLGTSIFYLCNAFIKRKSSPLSQCKVKDMFKNKISKTKKYFASTFLLFTFLSLGRCNSLLEKYKQNEQKLYGNLSEMKGLHNYQWIGSRMINLNSTALYPNEQTTDLQLSQKQSHPKDKNQNKEYTISHYQHNSQNWIVLEQVFTQPNGKVRYLLLDVLMLPPLTQEQSISYGNCRKNRMGDSEIIAVHENRIDTKDIYYHHILKAWRASRVKEKIEPLPINGISCRREYP